jgi:hypothetical protein
MDSKYLYYGPSEKKYDGKPKNGYFVGSTQEKDVFFIKTDMMWFHHGKFKYTLASYCEIENISKNAFFFGSLDSSFHIESELPSDFLYDFAKKIGYNNSANSELEFIRISRSFGYSEFYAVGGKQMGTNGYIWNFSLQAARNFSIGNPETRITIKSLEIYKPKVLINTKNFTDVIFTNKDN